MESRILDEDKDEWIYSSMKKYTNLYMFELEFPADTLQIIDDTSICMSGIQPFSKKCELVQLSIPAKLFPKDMEEGLVKDRDFQIVSGGYASNRIVQIEPLPTSVLACTQAGESYVTLYQLGNDDCAVIKEHSQLSPVTVSTTTEGHSSSTPPPIVPAITTISTSLFAAVSSTLHHWNLSTSIPAALTYPLPSKGSLITKLRSWDENVVLLLSDEGTVFIHDIRTAGSSSGTGTITSSKSHENSGDKPKCLFTFDILPSSNRVGILDTYGGYEAFDFRVTGGGGRRTLLPEEACTSSIIKDKLNIEYNTEPQQDPSKPQFLVSGLSSEKVRIFQEEPGAEADDLSVRSVFLHDGHTKVVTRATFHKKIKDLVFTTSLDSMLHAWQYAEQDKEESTN